MTTILIWLASREMTFRFAALEKIGHSSRGRRGRASRDPDPMALFPSMLSERKKAADSELRVVSSGSIRMPLTVSS